MSDQTTPDPTEDKTQSLEAYKIEQLEKELAVLKGSTEALSFGQIKDMFFWVGLPVAVATSVFGAALWIIITNVAEDRATVIAIDVAEKAADTKAQSVARAVAATAAVGPAEVAAKQAVQDLMPELQLSAQAAANSTAEAVASLTAQKVVEQIAPSAAAKAAIEPAQQAAEKIAQSLVADAEASAKRIAREEARDAAISAAEKVATLASDSAARETAERVAKSEARIAASEAAESIARRVAADAARSVATTDVVEQLTDDDAFIKQVSRSTERIFSEAVVAFASETGCPEGWSIYREAMGRFVVGALTEELRGQLLPGFEKDSAGAKLEARPIVRPGGSQKHTLTVAEMPIHDHIIVPDDERQMLKMNYYGVGSDVGVFSTYKNSELGLEYFEVSTERGAPKTKTNGKGDSHNNMPPYIALYFCKKGAG